MPDREFIHSTADVASTLLFALNSGLLVMVDSPQQDPSPCMLTPEEAAKVERGSFYLFRPEWVFGPFQTMVIPSGHNEGRYFVQPRTNFAPVSVYFPGERIDHGTKRFGGAVVSWHRDWLEMPAKKVRPTPAEVQEWFKRINKQLSTKIVIPAGVHRYHVCKGVLADPTAPDALPPFDYIPWGKDVLGLCDETPARPSTLS
jgi:hypothetical protein